MSFSAFCRARLGSTVQSEPYLFASGDAQSGCGSLNESKSLVPYRQTSASDMERWPERREPWIVRLPGHELAYQFRIVDLPVVGQHVRSAQDHLGSIVQFDGNVVEFHGGQKFLRDF